MGVYAYSAVCLWLSENIPYRVLIITKFIPEFGILPSAPRPNFSELKNFAALFIVKPILEFAILLDLFKGGQRVMPSLNA